MSVETHLKGMTIVINTKNVEAAFTKAGVEKVRRYNFGVKLKMKAIGARALGAELKMIEEWKAKRVIS